MWNNFFNHIDINPENVNILNGNAEDPEAECAAYEEKILQAGGIDLFMGGVGENGHIAFNEPFTSPEARTHLVSLTQDTIQVNSRFFNNDINLVPKQAVTVGIATVLASKEVMILALGAKKANAVQQCVEGCVNHACPITWLQTHQNGVLVTDEAAIENLKVGTYRYFLEQEA